MRYLHLIILLSFFLCWRVAPTILDSLPQTTINSISDSEWDPGTSQRRSHDMSCSSKNLIGGNMGTIRDMGRDKGDFTMRRSRLYVQVRTFFYDCGRDIRYCWGGISWSSGLRRMRPGWSMERASSEEEGDMGIDERWDSIEFRVFWTQHHH